MPPRSKDPFAPATRIESWPEHPLFPVDEGDDPPEVAFIAVTRKELGRMVWGPTFRADELTSQDQIFERFGGGEYELYARAHSKRDPSHPGTITKRRWMILPGKSLPLSANPTDAELRAIGEHAASSPAAPAPAPASSSAASGMGDNLLVAILQMQQQQQQQFMALMMQMMQNSKAESAELAKSTAAATQTMTTMLMQISGQQQQSMVGMMTALLQARGGGPEEMAKYAQLLKSLGVGGMPGADDKAGGESIGELVENAADIVQGLVMLKGGAPPPNGASSPPATAAPPGSAASVVEEAAKMQS